MDEAVEFLRKNGQAKAEKKASRIAAEGLCTVVVKDDTTAAVVEVNSETDFVAKNETFQSFVKAVAAQAVNSDAKDMDAFMAEAWNEDASKTVNDALVEKVAVIGENLKIRRFEKVVAEHGCVVSYEKEILLAQIMNDPKESQKPEKVINGMIEGRISKELKEVCLVDQVYVKAEDGKQTVAKYLDEVSKAVGCTVKVKRFVRFETGEGLEKKQEDFAAEVAAQMNA